MIGGKKITVKILILFGACYRYGHACGYNSGTTNKIIRAKRSLRKIYPVFQHVFFNLGSFVSEGYYLQ